MAGGVFFVGSLRGGCIGGGVLLEAGGIFFVTFFGPPLGADREKMDLQRQKFNQNFEHFDQNPKNFLHIGTHPNVFSVT